MTEVKEKKDAPKADVPAPVLNIIQIISAISKDSGSLAAKRSENGGVPFAFRGVDSVVNHLAPMMQKYGVVIVPEILQHNVTARELTNNQGVANGKAITQTELVAKFTFYAPDGTSISATTAGLAQDYADRSTAQAQSVAFRVALLQVFTLPTSDPEPEEAGESTQSYIAKAQTEAATTSRTEASIAKATADPLTEARTKVKAAAGKKSVTSARLNELGNEISDNFFNEVDALGKLLVKINEEA